MVPYILGPRMSWRKTLSMLGARWGVRMGGSSMLAIPMDPTGRSPFVSCVGCDGASSQDFPCLKLENCKGAASRNHNTTGFVYLKPVSNHHSLRSACKRHSGQRTADNGQQATGNRHLEPKATHHIGRHVTTRPFTKERLC